MKPSLLRRSGPAVVLAHVRRVGLVELQILQPVVQPVAVDVVDHLRAIKRPAEVLCHDESVLPDAALLVEHSRPRPVGASKNANVPARRHRPAALPPRRVRAGDPHPGIFGRGPWRLCPKRPVGGAHERVAARLAARPSDPCPGVRRAERDPAVIADGLGPSRSNIGGLPGRPGSLAKVGTEAGRVLVERSAALFTSWDSHEG